MYIAKARAYMINENIKSFKSDEILGVYLVEQKASGYDEVVTKKRLIKHDVYDRNIDSEANKYEEFGTISWEIMEK